MLGTGLIQRINGNEWEQDGLRRYRATGMRLWLGGVSWIDILKQSPSTLSCNSLLLCPFICFTSDYLLPCKVQLLMLYIGLICNKTLIIFHGQLKIYSQTVAITNQCWNCLKNMLFRGKCWGEGGQNCVLGIPSPYKLTLKFCLWQTSILLVLQYAC